MKILAIETSCDETAIALVGASGGLKAPKFKILKSEVASQIKIHRPFGGVVPNLAKREHQKNLPILFNSLFDKNSKVKSQKSKIQGKIKKLPVDLIAVTVGPGLEPALWTGITFAQELAKQYRKPLIGVSHLEGHLYSFLLPKKTSIKYQVSGIRNIFPAIALIVSGGHTILLKIESLAEWKKLGETRDDAVGEAFDKVARLLELPYPGGPEIEKASKNGNAKAIDFPRPMIYEKNYDFSFSGLKTAVLYYLRDTKNANTHELRENNFGSSSHHSSRILADIAASFQQAAIDVLVKKTARAAEEFKTKSILLSGGVAANKELRKEIQRTARKLGQNFLAAERKYNTDNAAMIAAAGYMDFLRKKKYPLKANGNLSI